MYQINKDMNRITRLEMKTFNELGFREREHLQEWISKDPDCLGEELLIIQKEFDGFLDTRERLDLLAIDKQGNLVIIENKLDDSGRDVTWQVLKYASYCSSLSKDDIRNIFQKHLNYTGVQASAEEMLADFLEKEDFEEVQLNQGTAQRIIMIAAAFRKEVTSTVLWLMNFNIRIQCFKVTPYKLDEQLFLNFDQILPVRDAQDYIINIASKAQEEIATQENLRHRHRIRLDFWRSFLDYSNKRNQLFSNISPSKENWLGIGIGMTGFGINVVISRDSARGEVYLNTGIKEVNKDYFDFLHNRKDLIDKEFGEALTWDRMDDYVICRIKIERDGLSINNEEDWPALIEFLADAAERLEKAFRNIVKQLNQKVKQGDPLMTST